MCPREILKELYISMGAVITTNMKIGLLAFSTNTGLGYQTRDFYKNIMEPEVGMNYPHKVLIADISKLNGMPVDHSWAYQPRITDGLPTNEECEWLVDGMDVIFVCETPLNPHLFAYANQRGVKTVLQYNYEFLNYLQKPDEAKPDVLAAPSFWGFKEITSKNWAEVTYWPVPIDIDRFTFREMQKVDTFAHIIGRPAHSDRNGTIIFLEAAKKLKEYNYVVYLQRPREGRTSEHFMKVDDAIIAAKEAGVKIEVIEDVEDNAEMYKRGEIMVLPRRYGGLCLPMWEALAAGMPVIMPNISPNETNLPADWLVEAKPNGSFEARTTITLYESDVDDLVSKMLSVAGNIQKNNLLARDLASRMSWQAQKPEYLKRFEKLCELSSTKK